LLSFLREFAAHNTNFANPSWAQIALLRYRMFLSMRVAHPTALLIPTSDILFAELSHVFRTDAYHSDLGTTLMASDLLELPEGEGRLYNEAVKGTATLWAGMFPSVPFVEGDIPPWIPFKHEVVSYGRQNPFCQYTKPLPYVPSVGSIPNGVNVDTSDLPQIQLNAQDLLNDWQWYRLYSFLLEEMSKLISV
jgi:hypothetical protein